MSLKWAGGIGQKAKKPIYKCCVFLTRIVPNRKKNETGYEGGFIASPTVYQSNAKSTSDEGVELDRASDFKKPAPSPGKSVLSTTYQSTYKSM